jgi:hypothetical protein
MCVRADAVQERVIPANDVLVASGIMRPLLFFFFFFFFFRTCL